ncbi:uncharacterized protein LODBEIA_P42830 [Lodderomyces beijingensis]|uniref:Uncharacterized protein n=1 Tax=Lodderomyces beijingensis TaxID=1775926 RepID=A0ABP0ZPJ1_9ASCO
MPPKKKLATITILKLKKGKLTYTLTVQPPITLDAIKTQLAVAINSSGGLQSAEEEVVDEEIDAIEDDIVADADGEDEEDIPVPKSEYIEEEEEEEEEQGEQVMEEVSGETVEADDIRVAVPRNPASPYDNEWVELDDSNVEEVAFKDYYILAFATIPGEEFSIVEAAYEE